MTDGDGPQDAVVIERSFDAPVDLIWQMWTDPEHFAAWYGPDGATIPVAEMDVRVGGARLVSMSVETPNGPMQMWFTGVYREVVENQRLVYTEPWPTNTAPGCCPPRRACPMAIRPPPRSGSSSKPSAAAPRWS